MFDYIGSFEHAISALKREQRYRVFIDLERQAGQFPYAVWNGPDGPRDVVVWCSNDYLGMGQHPKVIEAICTAARSMGAGAAGGYRQTLAARRLELRLRKFRRDAARLPETHWHRPQRISRTFPRLTPHDQW